jgi:hypothetical protein
MSTTAKAIKADQAVKADHEILVTLKDKEVVPHMPHFMKLGETVHYKSKDGKVTIEFVDNGSPYEYLNGREKKKVTSKEPPLKLKKKGIFTGRCYIKTPEGEEYGWGPHYHASGGNHDVR